MYVQYISGIFILLIASRLKIHKFRLLKQCKTGSTAERIQKHIYNFLFICGKNVLVYIDSQTQNKEGQVQGRQRY